MGSERTVLVLALLAAVAAGQCYESEYSYEGRCYSCPYGCYSCSDEYSCLSCKYGYTLGSGECYYHHVNVLGIIIFAVFVGLFIVLLMMMVGAMINHRRRMRNRPPVPVTAVASPPVVNPETLSNFNAQVVHFDLTNDECSICLEHQCNVLTVCGHYYHFKCIKEWTKHQMFCPNCKSNCMHLKSRCPRCLNFTRNFQMCPQGCQAEEHFACVSTQLAADCQFCVNSTGEQRLPESQHRLA